MKSACVKNESLWNVVQLGRAGVHVWFDDSESWSPMVGYLSGVTSLEVDAEIVTGLERLCLLPTHGEQAEVLSLLPDDRYAQVLSTYVSLLFRADEYHVH